MTLWSKRCTVAEAVLVAILCLLMVDILANTYGRYVVSRGVKLAIEAHDARVRTEVIAVAGNSAVLNRIEALKARVKALEAR